MDPMWEILEQTSRTGVSFSLAEVLLSLLLAFLMGQLLAWIYCLTHSGLSYSRSFVQSLILITVVVAMVMTVIENNIVTAVGLMGALAIIRFRNIIKDTRDIAFIFCSLVIGMATGSQRYGTAIIGCVVLCLIVVYLHVTQFGRREPHNGFLRFSLKSHIGPKHAVTEILKRFCRSHTLISAQDSGFGSPMVEYAYQLMIRNAQRNALMLAELEKVEDIENISLTMQEQLLEI